MDLALFYQENKTKVLIVAVAGGLILFGLMVYFLLTSLSTGGGSGPVSLEFWSVYDDPTFYKDAVERYRTINPQARIIFRRFNFDDYEKRLVDAFASGTGPDIWLTHHTWLPKHGDKIAPLPQDEKSQKVLRFGFGEFRNKFVDVAATDLTLNGQIYALPLYVDTLALYYNKDIFNSLGMATPPATWDEFNDSVIKATRLGADGSIVESGAAIGTARNINRSTDLLSLLMLQSGVQMTDSEGQTATFASVLSKTQNIGEVALQYYTDFANPGKQVFTWDDQQHYSVDAFAEGRTAMFFNYSHQARIINAKAPRLNFDVAPMPQINRNSLDVNYANYWAPTVSKQSKNILEAWRFLTFLATTDATNLYLNASNRPAARRDLIALQQQDPDKKVFADQALSARSWFQVDNGTIETIFAEMIDAINYGRSSIRGALQEAESKVTVLMQRNK